MLLLSKMTDAYCKYCKLNDTGMSTPNYSNCSIFFRDLQNDNIMICVQPGKITTVGFHIGYLYLIYAEKLVVNNPERLLLTTEWIYPDVAKHFGTTPACVEREIRDFIRKIWMKIPGRLQELVRASRSRPPTNAEMIAALVCQCYHGFDRAA